MASAMLSHTRKRGRSSSHEEESEKPPLKLLFRISTAFLKLAESVASAPVLVESVASAPVLVESVASAPVLTENDESAPVLVESVASESEPVKPQYELVELYVYPTRWERKAPHAPRKPSPLRMSAMLKQVVRRT